MSFQQIFHMFENVTATQIIENKISLKMQYFCLINISSKTHI